MSLFFIRRIYSRLKITDIIQAVKNTDNINSVCHRFLHEILYHIICIGTIAQNILSAEEHLKLCVFESVAEFSQSVPRIFLQETKRCVKCRASPALYCMVADFIHLVDDREHLFCCHSGGNQ